MITIRKLRTLKESTRLRKYISILKDFESYIQNNREPDFLYLASIINEISLETNISDRIKVLCKQKATLQTINRIRHNIMTHLGIEPSEWDFTSPKDGTLSSENKIESGMQLYLEDIRSPFNMGSLFRSSECFGVSKIFLSEDSTSPEHKRAIRTSMGCIEKINWERKKVKTLKGPIFALELGGTEITKFNFPRTGTAIIGSEELGVSPEALKIADDSLGRVTIPLYGDKSSLNVASATAILLQRWRESILES
jgi:TrmH family RNA methyltransferase